MERSEAVALLGRVEYTLKELGEKFNPVGIGDNAVVVTQLKDNTPPALEGIARRPDLREIGTTGQSTYVNMVRLDYNPEMRGLLALRTYDKMRRNDAQIASTLRLIKTPIRSARWYVQSASESRSDKRIAEQISNTLFKWPKTSWQQTMDESLAMLDFGYYMFEKVWKMYNGKVIIDKMAPRHPMDIIRWWFNDQGDPLQAEFFPLSGDFTFYTIPFDKLALFVFEQEAGDITGRSLLRTAYKHWFYKDNMYKIDAIQKERHGVGIPIIVLPLNYNANDMALADEIGRNLRANEKAHVVVPVGWEIGFLKLEGTLTDALLSVEHHDMMLAHNILAPFLNITRGQGGEEDSEKQDLFLKSVRYIADTVRNEWNQHIIPELVRWNYGPNVEPPELRVRRIGDTQDWRVMSFALRNLVGAGLIIPDDELEMWLRDEMDLPAMDQGTQRFVVDETNPEYLGPNGWPMQTPPGGAAPEQAPGQQPQARAALPRQSQAGKSRQGKTTPSKSAGTDVSGTSAD